MKNKSIEIKENNITYTVNYYTELYGVISVLSANQKAIKNAGVERGNALYRNAILKFFEKFKDNQLCKTFELLSSEYYFNYNAPVELFLQLDNNKVNRKSLCKMRRLIPSKMFKDVILQVKNFEKESNFKQFYEANVKTYISFINNYKNDLNKFSPIEYLLNCINLKTNKKFYINLMGAVASSNYGVAVGNKMYANVRPYKVSRFKDEPDYSYYTIDFTTLVLHEFAHSFINDLVEKHKALLKRIDISKYKEILDNTSYGDNIEIYIDETIIRAIECLYVKDVFPADYEAFAKDYYDEGFIKIYEVITALQFYIENKKKFKNIKNFIPHLIKLF